MGFLMRLAFWLSVVVTSLAAAWGLWFGEFPLGVRGEWEWSRVEPAFPLWLAILPPLVAAGIYLAFVRRGARRIEQSRQSALWIWLAGLSIAGFAWLWVVQESAPQGYQLSKAAWVLYFRGSSGYFSEAHDNATDLTAYLAGYEKKMAEGDVLHIGTHPPGLVVVFRGLIGICNAFPSLVDLANALEPGSVRGALDALEQTSAVPISRVDRAVLWLAALLVQASAALCVVPLFGLLRRTNSRSAAWVASSFWPAVPALAVFLPKSDCMYPVLTMAFLWLWLSGLDRDSKILCALAGFALFLGMTLSLAFLPVAFLALVTTICGLFTHGPLKDVQREIPAASPQASGRSAHFAIHYGQSRSLIPAVACGAAGFSVPVFDAWAVLKLNMLAVWWMNVSNHAHFYRQFPRTWWKWVLINPIEFSMAAGVPLVVLALWSMWRELRPISPARARAWAFLATFAILWLSGKNMGEAARLWIFLVPILIWMTGPIFESRAPSSSGEPSFAIAPPQTALGLSPSGWGWTCALGLELTMALVTVTRVAGFHYP